MNTYRISNRWWLLLLLALLSLTVTSCSNIRRGISWPTLEKVEIDGRERILVIFDNQVDAIDPYQGGQIHVVRDNDGEIIRTSDGKVQEWRIIGSQVSDSQFFTAPYVEGNQWVFPTYNNRLIQVDMNTGLATNTEGIPLSDGVLADVVTSDELVYIPYRQRDVVALNRETFEAVWQVETGEGVWASPLLHDDILYFGSIDHNLYAVDAQTGANVWENPVDLEGAVASTPLIYNDFLYIGSYSHKLYKINLDGDIVAEYEGHNWVWGTPTIFEDILYYTDLSGYVYALNPEDLSILWSERPASRGIRPAPVVVDEYVIVASRDGYIYWLNRETGQTIQQVEVTGRPELLSDLLYLPADEGDDHPPLLLVASSDVGRMVSAINMNTFTEQWVYGR